MREGSEKPKRLKIQYRAIDWKSSYSFLGKLFLSRAIDQSPRETLGIYLGLKAKKELEKHSEFVESSQREFFVFKDGKNLGPLDLKKIRVAPADGEMGLEDTPIAKDSGEKKTIVSEN